MRSMACLAGIVAVLVGCGAPPNERLLTRTATYDRALSLVNPSGNPLDIAALERHFPELKGIVITAAQWIDEYEKLKKESEERGKPLYEFRIPYGANMTIEVTGEPTLTRNYTVPPNGEVHYPYIGKLKLNGLTMDEVKANMERELAVYLKKPEVLVHINATQYQPNVAQPFFQQSFGGAEIILLGAARSRYFSNLAFTGKETLISVIGNSDFPSNSEWRQIRVIRRDAKDPLRKSRIIIADLWDYFAKGDVRQDVPLAPGDVVYVPVRWSTDDQFWEDWSYVKRIMSDVFFVDQFKDGFKKGGELRN